MNLITPGASGFRDCMHTAHDLAAVDGVGLIGYGVVELFDGDMKIKSLSPFGNLITDAGDLYYAQKAIVGISPAAPSAPTAMNGMKLGTGVTAVAKSGAGGAIVTYVSGSNIAFDATFPSTTNLGGGLGVNATYKTTFAAGVATNAALTEAAIVNDQATNATTTAANTMARAIITTTNKGASDTLAITWNTKFLGA